MRHQPERAWFLQPRHPAAASRRADELRLRLGSERFFNEPGLSWLREAWTISKFGRLAHARAVRLHSTDPPDGFICWETGEYPVEVTEALEPGRRRGAEYRAVTREPVLLGQALLTRHEREFSDWVRDAALRKAAASQKLPSNTLVLIHLSAWLFFIKPAQITRRLAEALPPPSGNIGAYAVLHSGKIYSDPQHSHFKTV